MKTTFVLLLSLFVIVCSESGDAAVKSASQAKRAVEAAEFRHNVVVNKLNAEHDRILKQIEGEYKLIKDEYEQSKEQYIEALNMLGKAFNVNDADARRIATVIQELEKPTPGPPALFGKLNKEAIAAAKAEEAKLRPRIESRRLRAAKEAPLQRKRSSERSTFASQPTLPPPGPTEAQPPISTPKLQVFTLKNHNAERMVSTLTPLFVNQTNVPMVITFDEVTNTVIARGAEEELQILEALISRLAKLAKEKEERVTPPQLSVPDSFSEEKFNKQG